jgi:hypothetical protein
MTQKEKNSTETNSIIPRRKPLLIPPNKRPSSPLNRWIKETKHSYQITRKDICYIYRNIIFTKTFGELKNIMEDEEKRDRYPALVIAIIAGVLGDIARGNIINLTRMLQFVFPDVMKGFDPDEFASKSGQGGYDEIKELENALRRLEGDDGLLIVDKLLMPEIGKYEIVNDAH